MRLGDGVLPIQFQGRAWNAHYDSSNNILHSLSKKGEREKQKLDENNGGKSRGMCNSTSTILQGRTPK